MNIRICISSVSTDLRKSVSELAKNNTPVYFTIDLDCLDPSVFCGTGTPEAGGVTFPGAPFCYP